MFGGLAIDASDRIHFVAVQGSVVSFDADTGAALRVFGLAPFVPDDVHIAACAMDGADGLLLADSKHRYLRRFGLDGTPRGRIGRLPNPGLPAQDDEGVLSEVCDVLPCEDRLFVACGGEYARHGLQVFSQDGAYERSIPRPGGWRRVQGLARIGDEIWAAETDAGAIRRFTLAGEYAGDVELHPDIKRPVRLVRDRFGGALLLLAPETEEDHEAYGVARLAADGTFDGWSVHAGEDPGQVYGPYDVATLSDGNIAVLDLPFGGPPEVRLQLFTPSGQLLRVLFADTSEARELQATWLETTARNGPAYERARVHHYHSGQDPAHLEQAADLYREAMDAGERSFLPAFGLGALLQHGLSDPAGAEQAYDSALAAGADPRQVRPRIAECRWAADDQEGAIALLQDQLENDHPGEDYFARLEELADWLLERAGEA